MVEALLLGVMASVLQQAVIKLLTRFQELKGTEAESRELQDFINYLLENSSLRISSIKMRSMLRQTLDGAKIKLEEWSGKKSGFLARSSSTRVRDLKAQRRSVEHAISLANLWLADDANSKLNDLYKQFGWAQNHAQDPAQNLAKDLAQNLLPEERHKFCSLHFHVC